MAIMFCEKCSKIIKFDYDKISGKNLARCSCGFEVEFDKDLHDISATEQIKEKPEKGKGTVKDENRMATFPHKCRRCGHDFAEIIDLGIWYSDEAGVVRYKCGKCGITEQDIGSNT